MLLLEGEQGSVKSSTVSILGGEWAYTGYIDPSDKDTVMNFLGAWVIEIAELSGMNRGDQNHIKGFVTTAVDKIRPPYGRVSIPIPRQCVFIGTTNDDRYLRDESGNRRYWPVKVGATKFTELARDRDQLFAEAKILYDLGEEVYISDKELQLTERAEQMRRLVALDYEDALVLWVANKIENPSRDPIDIKSFTINELFDYPLSFDFYNKQNAWHVGKVLERLRFFKLRSRKNGEHFKGWSITDDALAKIEK
jgi:predicted P-loop ATPase